jgi:hypothetical protein
LCERLLDEQDDRHDGREQERTLRRHEQCQCAYRNDQSTAEAARHSTACVDQQRDRCHIYDEQHVNLNRRSRKSALQERQLRATDQEQDQQRDPCERRVGPAHDPRLIDEVEDCEQDDR